MTLRDPRSASESYLKARQVETSLYGEGHPDLIATEYSLAAASYSLGDINAATEAINRCLRLIRRGGPQARLWRDQALSLAIAIDVAASPGLPPS